MATIENILVGIIGRPILTLIKWLRWFFLIGGLFINVIETYDPVRKEIVSRNFTVIPLIVGFILFCIGLTIKRYDEAYKDYIKFYNEIQEERGEEKFH